ncbi:uncharacterized protein LOC142624936 [Castanea sativa]|uniref:uncharacterized protein LOC142624936 n=1 Tax=Castanea sativa TaxID=21020 RepID=UPI003F651DC3
MPWVVFGDFNEITQSDEKLGWLDRDAEQMWKFRDCLIFCGLMDLGFVGQRFTWCNERLGEQRTLVRLDRIVANKEWRRIFPEAMVHHVSITASDHCLLMMSMKKRKPNKPRKKRSFFEEMWTHDKRCKEIVEMAWDLLRANPEFQIQDRLQSCQSHLMRWNHEAFGNVNKVLKRKQDRLQQLENMDLLHDTTEEIQQLRREINETLIREEVMWKQRSKALSMRWGDRNTKFFHATTTQRQWHNKIEVL